MERCIVVVVDGKTGIPRTVINIKKAAKPPRFRSKRAYSPETVELDALTISAPSSWCDCGRTPGGRDVRCNECVI